MTGKAESTGAERPNLCIDLCSGLGGLSEAFVREGWTVMRLDNNPRFAEVPHTVIADITDIGAVLKTLEPYGVPELIVSSPPARGSALATGCSPRSGSRRP
jgi:hypothetical protein